MKAIKLGKEIIDPTSIANAWASGRKLRVIIKGHNGTAYVDMGTEENANKALSELLKAMNGEEFQNVDFVGSSKPEIDEEKAKGSTAVLVILCIILGFILRGCA